MVLSNKNTKNDNRDNVDNSIAVVSHCLYCRFYVIESWDLITLNSQLLILNSKISIRSKP